MADGSIIPAALTVTADATALSNLRTSLVTKRPADTAIHTLKQSAISFLTGIERPAFILHVLNAFIAGVTDSTSRAVRGDAFVIRGVGVHGTTVRTRGPDTGEHDAVRATKTRSVFPGRYLEGFQDE